MTFQGIRFHTGVKNIYIEGTTPPFQSIEHCMVPENRKHFDVLIEEYKIESLSLRRKRNLVKIMYSQSSQVQNIKIDTVTINLRSKKKVHMKKDFTSKTKVLNSPLYRGLKLWDSLLSDMQKEKDT